MTETDWDKVYKLKDKIWSAVHELVDAELAGVSAEIDDEVRQQLTDDFRFWKTH